MAGASSAAASTSAPLGRWFADGRPRRARAEDEALAQRVGGQPVRSVQPRAGALADRVEALHGGAAIEIVAMPPIR